MAGLKEYYEKMQNGKVDKDLINYVKGDVEAAMHFMERLEEQKKEESKVQGVSKDEPRVVNEHGGSQSRTLYDFTLADPKAMFEMCKVLKEGADKYGRENWRLIDVEDHLNHLLIHVYAYLAGDKSDDHLSHIMCRALFAQGVAVQTEDDVDRVKKSRDVKTPDDSMDAVRYAIPVEHLNMYPQPCGASMTYGGKYNIDDVLAGTVKVIDGKVIINPLPLEEK